MVKGAITFVGGRSACILDLGSQFAGHPAIEGSADSQPPAIGVALVGEPGGFGLGAGVGGCGEAVLGKMTEGSA